MGKSLLVANYIQEKIHSGEFAAGDRIPSIRTLMEDFQVSNGAVKRGIDHLDDLGLIERVHGSGTFVKKRRRPRTETLRLAVFFTGDIRHFSSGIYPTIFWGMQEAAARRNCSLLVNYLRVETATAKRIVDMSAGMEGVIFLAEYDASLSTVPLAVPGVGVSMRENITGNLSIVDIDPHTSAEQAAGYFRKHACRKVVVVSSDHPAYRLRGSIFSLLWQDENGETETVTYRDELPNPEPGVGFLFTSGSILQTYSTRSLTDTGKTLAQRATILGIDGKNRLDPTMHVTPAIAVDWRAVGVNVLEECLFRIHHPGAAPRRIYVQGRLVE